VCAGQAGEKTLLDVAGVLKDTALVSGWRAVDREHYNVEVAVILFESRLWRSQDDALVKIANAYRYLTANAAGSATAEAHFADDPVDLTNMGHSRMVGRLIATGTSDTASRLSTASYPRAATAADQRKKKGKCYAVTEEIKAAADRAEARSRGAAAAAADVGADKEYESKRVTRRIHSSGLNARAMGRLSKAP